MSTRTKKDHFASSFLAEIYDQVVGSEMKLPSAGPVIGQRVVAVLGWKWFTVSREFERQQPGLKIECQAAQVAKSIQLALKNAVERRVDSGSLPAVL